MRRVPKFKSEKEEAEFWSTHSVADYWNDLEEVEEKIEVSGRLKSKILERKERKKLLTLRLGQKQIEEAKKIAMKKTIGYQTLMRMWIAEGIRREKRSA